ncbi:hypothetical protein [Streptomyces collinus]
MTETPGDDRRLPPTLADPELTALAERHAATPRRPAADIVREARAAFPTFTEDLWALCR